MDDTYREQLLSSCFRFLLPVSRCLLNAGVSYREFDELARRAFVVTATTHYGIRGRPTSNSRVSIMTGISRKEIARMRQEDDLFSNDVRDVLGPLADLVTTWSTSPDWTDESGSPRLLTYEDGQSSFKRLAAETVGDRPVRAVRRELERLGTVDFSNEEAISLRSPYLIPSEQDKRLLGALAYSMRALAETVAHNCSEAREETGEWLERYVESCDLSEEDAAIIRQEISERLDEFSRQVDALLSSRRSNSGAADKAIRKRIGVGLFYSE